VHEKQFFIEIIDNSKIITIFAKKYLYRYFGYILLRYFDILDMNRRFENKLLQWKQRKNALPLMLAGARQTGKTYLLSAFCHRNFKRLSNGLFKQIWYSPAFW
jgi:hypothetical protein